jgi:hypothetical protein
MSNATRTSAPRSDERRDKQAAEQPPRSGAQDRPGFDLGGAADEANEKRSELPPSGPRTSAAAGGTATGRATGSSDPSGSQSLGNKGSEPGSESGVGPTEGSRGAR